jgi:ribosomal protein S18 acetylase RimI-like enzyme
MYSISVTLLKDANIDALREFAESIWTIAYRDIISGAQIRYMLDRLYHPDLLRDQVALGHPLFGAYSGEDLVGYAHVFFEGHQSRLDKLYVAPLYQGIGVGRKLVDEAVRFAIGSDCSLMTLRVNRNNLNAVAAYEHFGFGILATHKKDIGGGYIMDDYLMMKDLNMPN